MNALNPAQGKVPGQPDPRNPTADDQHLGFHTNSSTREPRRIALLKTYRYAGGLSIGVQGNGAGKTKAGP